MFVDEVMFFIVNIFSMDFLVMDIVLFFSLGFVDFVNCLFIEYFVEVVMIWDVFNLFEWVFVMFDVVGICGFGVDEFFIGVSKLFILLFVWFGDLIFLFENIMEIDFFFLLDDFVGKVLFFFEVFLFLFLLLVIFVLFFVFSIISVFFFFNVLVLVVIGDWFDVELFCFIFSDFGIRGDVLFVCNLIVV